MTNYLKSWQLILKCKSLLVAALVLVLLVTTQTHLPVNPVEETEQEE